MGKRTHWRSKTSPGFTDGGNSFGSVFEESPNKPEEQEEESELDPHIILKIQNLSQLGVNPVNFSEQGDDYPIFNDFDSDSEDDELLTFWISEFSYSQGRMRSLIQSRPSVQAMDQSGEGYDPHRIPATIFETNRTLEWSVASNESLFSLNFGRTNSLSHERLFSLGGGDMNKSGELDPMSGISDVEVDHVLKRIAEYDADEERITQVRDEIGLNQTKDELKQVISGEASLRHGDSAAKVSKSSEEKIESTNSSAFHQLLADDTTPERSSSIQMQQHEPEPRLVLEGAVEKARSKSWFVCCSFSSCFLGSCSCSFCSSPSCLPNK